jgi:hypothetical protein
MNSSGVKAETYGQRDMLRAVDQTKDIFASIAHRLYHIVAHF